MPYVHAHKGIHESMGMWTAIRAATVRRPWMPYVHAHKGIHESMGMWTAIRAATARRPWMSYVHAHKGIHACMDMHGEARVFGHAYAALAATGTAHRRLIASIMAAGSATPLPAMSNALPWATDANRIGVPMARAAVALWASSFAVMCP